MGAVTVDIGALPTPPAGHNGYNLARSGELPLTLIEGSTITTPLSERTAAVREAIVAAASVNNAADVTVDHLVAITRLDLSEQVITTLAARDFDDLTGLQSLRLNGNELTALPVGLFDGLMSLNAVYLQNNALTAVDADLFDGLTTLRYINLSDNELTLFPEDLFDGLTALRELYLGENTVSSFPEDLFEGLTGLWALGLNNMGLSSLPPDLFDGLTGLGELYLRHNNLSSLPEDLFEGLTELRDIYLRYNSLTELPPDVFDGLTGLNSLYLNHNDLTTLPAGIFEGLENLQRFNLDQEGVPMALTIGLEKVGTDQVKVVVPVGSPFSLDIQLTITNGRLATADDPPIPADDFLIPEDAPIQGGAPDDGVPGPQTNLRVLVSTGSVESETFRVVRRDGARGAVTVNIPEIPIPLTRRRNPNLSYKGYELVLSEELPLRVLEPVIAAPSINGVVLDTNVLERLSPDALEMFLETLLSENDGSLKYKRAIALVESVLATMRPDETRLLANYPNPFNPETWIPYHLSQSSDVWMTIYNARGSVVRELSLGHQDGGYYTSRSRAAYWDGRNEAGEPVSSGIYFYQLRAEGVSLLRKMVILK